MLSVENKSIMLSVVVLNVVMLSVMAPTLLLMLPEQYQNKKGSRYWHVVKHYKACIFANGPLQNKLDSLKLTTTFTLVQCL